MTTHRLRDVAMVLTSNVDKIIDPDEHPVRLCNYVDVYKNNFIYDDLPFKIGSANSSEIKKFGVKIDDVIITKDSETADDIGVPALVKSTADDLVCGYHLSILRSDHRRIIGPFLYWHLLSKKTREDLGNAANGVTRFGLTLGGIKGIPINLPNLSTQHEIADFLDRETARIDLLIEKKQRFIEVLKSKLDSKIYRIITSGVHNQKIDESVDLIWQKGIPVSWQAKKVKHLFRLVADPAPPNNDFELLSVYTAIGVRPRKDLEERGNKASTTDGYWRVQKGDIIVNKLLAWMGAIGVSEYSGVTSPAYDILRPIQKLEPFYYHYLFRIPRFSSELKRHSRGIMEMRLRLYFENFGRILVPVPPADEQQAIVSALRRKEEEHDLLSAKTVQSIDRLKEYRSALITAAVTGQIDVTTYSKSGTTDRRLDVIQEEMST